MSNWKAHLNNACQPNDEPVEAGERCTGACCRCFALPWDHATVGRWLLGEELPIEYVGCPEVEMVLSMVRPLPDEGTRQYTCVLFDGRDCQAYGARPEMCSGYPYGRRCEHGKLCASTEARRGEIDRPERSRLRLTIL